MTLAPLSEPWSVLSQPIYSLRPANVVMQSNGALFRRSEGSHSAQAFAWDSARSFSANSAIQVLRLLFINLLSQRAPRKAAETPLKPLLNMNIARGGVDFHQRASAAHFADDLLAAFVHSPLHRRRNRRNHVDGAGAAGKIGIESGARRQA